MEQLLFVATGIEHQDSSSSSQSSIAELVWEIVARELENLILLLPNSILHAPAESERLDRPGRQRKPQTHHLLPLIRFLSQNDFTLRRFVRRMIVIDAVHEIQEGVKEGGVEKAEISAESAAGLYNLV